MLIGVSASTVLLSFLDFEVRKLGVGELGEGKGFGCLLIAGVSNGRFTGGILGRSLEKVKLWFITQFLHIDTNERGLYLGWAKFMEWKYKGVEVVITSKRTFNTTGAIEAAAPL